MSKGGGTQTTTSSVDPEIKTAYLQNLQQAQGVAASLPQQQFAPMNAMYQSGEQALTNAALAGQGLSSVDQAAYRTSQEGTYQPAMVGGFSGGPASEAGAIGYGASDVNAAQANLGMGGAGSIGSYMNPYSQLVTQNALGDLEASRQNALRQTAQQAQQARAFGGSRQGVAEAQTNLGFTKQYGDLAARLNEQAFNQAMAAQQQDLARQQQAAMQNAAQRSAASQFGAGAMNQSSLANAAARNQMAQFNANLGQNAALANQNIGLAGAQYRLGAANQLGNLGAQQQALRLGGAQAVMGAGGARQQLEQQQLDAIRNLGMQRLGIQQSALGISPADLGRITSTPMYQNRIGGALGGAAAGYQLGGKENSALGAALGGLLGYFG